MAKDNRELSLVNSNAYVTFLLDRPINNGSCGGHQHLGKLTLKALMYETTKCTLITNNCLCAPTLITTNNLGSSSTRF